MSGKSYSSYKAFLEDRYLNGGAIRHEVRGIFYQANSMLSKAGIVKRLDEAIRLQELYDNLVLVSKDKHIKFGDTIPLFQTISSYYEPIVDDALIFSAFEMYSKAILLNKQYIVHDLKTHTSNHDEEKLKESKKLVKDQKKTPMHFRTYRKLYNEGKILGVQETTLSGGVLLGDEYASKIGLSKEHVIQLLDIKKTRNKLHFMAFHTWSNSMEKFKLILFLKNEISKRV